MTVTKEEFDKYFDNINLELAKTKEDMSEEKKYRVEDGIWWIKIQIKLINSEKWEYVDGSGIVVEHCLGSPNYDTVDEAIGQIKRIKKGITYHYPPGDSPEI